MSESGPGPGQQAALRELHAYMLNELGVHLTDAQVSNLQLRLDGLSIQEIAEKNGEPVDTVKSRLHRASLKSRSETMHRLAEQFRTLTSEQRHWGGDAMAVELMDAEFDARPVRAFVESDVVWRADGFLEANLRLEQACSAVTPMELFVAVQSRDRSQLLFAAPQRVELQPHDGGKGARLDLRAFVMPRADRIDDEVAANFVSAVLMPPLA